MKKKIIVGLIFGFLLGGFYFFVSYDQRMQVDPVAAIVIIMCTTGMGFAVGYSLVADREDKRKRKTGG